MGGLVRIAANLHRMQEAALNRGDTAFAFGIELAAERVAEDQCERDQSAFLAGLLPRIRVVPSTQRMPLTPRRGSERRTDWVRRSRSK
jgi:hypothetical protein